MHLRTAHGCAKRIAQSIRRKFPAAAKLFFLMRHVWPSTGPDVVNRKAARLSGRTASERNAFVIDRFFDTKQKALAWAKAHPHFMTVQIVSPTIKQAAKRVATKDPSSRNIAMSQSQR
jgi:hypothetical protein